MTKPYDLPQIRALLLQGFSDEELRRLCHDTPQFRPVYHELARNTGKAAIVDRLLEHAQAKLLLDDLLALVQPPTPAVQAPPAAALPEDRGREEINSPPPLALSSPPPSPSPPPAPNHESQINNPKNLALPPGTDLILKKMFAGYWRVVILQEFGGGFSGSRIFLVQPQLDPRSAELRAVVKLASRSLIEKEWRAFHRCIRDQMPHITEVRGEPVLAENGWGGLHYLLLGTFSN